MNDQLTERLTRAADSLPPAAETAIVEVQRRARARRRHRQVRRGVAAMAVVAGVVVAVPAITAPDRSPEISPLVQQPESASPPGASSNEVEDPADSAGPRDVVEVQRAPQPNHLDAEVEFEVYAIVAPDGWQHVITGVRTILPDEGAWTWVDTRWTPTGGDGGGVRDARLHLRQTDVATLGGEPLPVYADADADHIEIPPGLTAYLITERLPSGIEHHLLQWQQGDTYLELSGQGLTAQALIDAATTAQPTPSE